MFGKVGEFSVHIFLLVSIRLRPLHERLPHRIEI